MRRSTENALIVFVCAVSGATLAVSGILISESRENDLITAMEFAKKCRDGGNELIELSGNQLCLRPGVVIDRR